MNALHEISKTALITLRSRIIESDRPNPILVDPIGKECFDKLLNSLPENVVESIMKRKLSSVLTRHLAIRARKYDALCMEFMKEYPDGLIVNIGSGFDTRFWRLDLKGSGYIEVDLPAVVHLKQEILGKRITFKTIEGSVLNNVWIKELSSVQSSRILFIAEGLFMYFREEESIRVLRDLAGSFEDSRLIMEVVNRKYTKGIRKKMVEIKMQKGVGTSAGDYFLYGIKNGYDLESYHPDYKLIREWSYFEDNDFKPAFLKILKNIRAIAKTQYTVIADIT